MARSRQREPKHDLGLFAGQDDAQTVDVLLKVASGPEFCPKAQREEVVRLQVEFEPLVQMAMDAPDELYTREFSARLQELAQGGVNVTLGAELVRYGRQRIVYVRHFRDIHAVLSEGVLLLMDEHKPYGRTLCRCRLPSCRKFYLARRNPKGGPANRTYCSPEHREEHHNSAERKATDAATKRARKGK